MKLKSEFTASLIAGSLALAFSASLAAQTVRIGAVYPLTGGVSYDGITKLNGAKLAIKIPKSANISRTPVMRVRSA